MARLFRFTNLNDRFETHVFTFLLPAAIAGEVSRDVHSKDFTYGYQKWKISVCRNDKHMGAYLSVQNSSEGMICTLDYGFTFINKEHFTKNESIWERNCTFTFDKQTQGRKNLIGVLDLCSRGFQQENGEFLFELEMRNMKTSFEQIMQLPRDPKDTQSSAYNHRRFESNYFTFGNFDWSISLYPFGDTPQNDGRSLVCLTRQTNFDHLCKIRYRVILGHGEKALETDTIEQSFDTSGQGQFYDMGYDISTLTSSKSRLKLKLDLLTVSAISEVQLSPLNRAKNRAHIYDRDKQAWMLESDISGEYLKFRFYYAEVRNVPRRHMRHTCWNFSVVPWRHHLRPIRALGSPFSNCYSQTDTAEESFDMSTDIRIDEMNNLESAFLDEESRRLTVQVEWVSSHLLFCDKVHQLDEIANRHKHQMWREIMALQAENYSLEKQLHSYQQSISKNSSRDKVPEESSPKGCYPGDYYPQDEPPQYSRRARPGSRYHKSKH